MTFWNRPSPCLPRRSTADIFIRPSRIWRPHTSNLVKNHPFVDGNKRVGTMAAILFLSLNNYYLDATDEEFTKLVLQVAAGEKTLRGISFFFHRHAHPKHSRKRNI